MKFKMENMLIELLNTKKVILKTLIFQKLNNYTDESIEFSKYQYKLSLIMIDIINSFLENEKDNFQINFQKFKELSSEAIDFGMEKTDKMYDLTNDDKKEQSYMNFCNAMKYYYEIFQDAMEFL